MADSSEHSGTAARLTNKGIMTNVSRTAIGDHLYDQWPASLRVSWFTLAVVFGGLIQLAFDFSGLSVPVDVLARVALLASAIPVLLVTQEKGRSVVLSGVVPPSVRLASALLFFSGAISFAKDAVESSNISHAALSVLFMYGIGGFLLFAAFVPLSARFRMLFLAFSGASIGFGLVQLVSQKLFLPPDYLTSVGLLYENFVNDRLRLVSVFRSAPRFAELLTFISLLILSQILLPSSARIARRRTLLLLTYGLVLILLFNTYSRAGYALFLSSSVVMLILMRNAAFEGRLWRFSSYLVPAIGAAAAILILLGKMPFDSSILDDASLLARQASWSELFETIRDGSALDYLFGFGVTARFARGEFGYFIIDNLPLALFLYSGAVGLLAALFISIAAVRFAVLVRRVGGRTLEPWIAFIPCLWLEGSFVDNHNTLFISLIAMLGVVSSARRRNNSQTAEVGQTA